MVGNNSRGHIPGAMLSSSPTKQQDTMHDFKLGKIAIIVATSVLEEGKPELFPKTVLIKNL
jgi:ERCC4-related helicase